MTQTQRSIEILIVDDSCIIRQRLMALLTKIDGVEMVGEAESVEQGLEFIRAHNPDVVTLDMMMPGGNGLQLLEQITHLDQAPTTIVLTNYPYPAFRKRSMEMGADFFLSKATEIRRLPEILKECSRRMEDEQ